MRPFSCNSKYGKIQRVEFIPETALGYARAIARPRRVGSSEEQAIANELAARLEQFGYQVERQLFRFSTAPTVFISLEVLACLLLILAVFWLRGRTPWVPVPPAVLLVLLVLLTGPINRAVLNGSLAPASGKPSFWSALCLRMGTQYSSANLVATLPDLPDNPTLPYLYLVAHYDSKSQRIPLAVRVVLFVIAIAGGLTFAGLTFLAVAFPALTWAATVVGILAVLAGLPLLMLDTGNASPGAIDNASSVGLVLHLAECLSLRSGWRDRLRVTILATSAEEMTLMGAVAFAREKERMLRRQAEAGGLHILNFDGVGVDGKLYLAGNLPATRGAKVRHFEGSEESFDFAQGDRPQDLQDLIREACGELGLPLERFGLTGVMFDHMPFAQRGFDAVSLIAVGEATRSVHTPGDSADKLHVRGFELAGQVVLRVIEKLGIE